MGNLPVEETLMNKKRNCKVCGSSGVVIHNHTVLCAGCYVDEGYYLKSFKTPSGKMGVMVDRDRKRSSLTLPVRKPTPVIRRKLYEEK